MPQHKRGPWSQSEDQMLLHLVTVHGAQNWVRIASGIQTRSPKQCRERFHQNLKPNLNHEPITPEEGMMIEQMVAEMGKRWAEIARRLRGRSDNAVKNWWNGGMNRRRRSQQQRRTELEVRQQAHAAGQMQGLAHPIPQQPLPPAFHSHPMMPAHYFPGAPMFHPGQPHPPAPPHISLPSNVPGFGRHGLIETPLPSPSAYSQMSADGAPSLISDCSSISARSPMPGTSPIELPPLGGARDDRRRSSASMLRLGVPASYVHEAEFHHPGMHMHAHEAMAKQPPPMLQEAFMPQQNQPLPQPMQYLPSQPRQPASYPQQAMQQFAMQQHHHQQQQQQQQQQELQRRTASFTVPSSQVPSTPTGNLQLPSISKNLNHTHDPKMSVSIDPALATPLPSDQSPDGSPKDKMSLSNLTL